MNLFKKIFDIKIVFLILILFFLSSSNAETIFAAKTYTYDPNGNMTSDGTNCYSYNEANQLSRVNNCTNNQLIAEYLYDASGNRIIKKVYINGVLSKTVYSPNDSYETDKDASTGTTQNTTYYFADNQLLAKKNPDGTKEYSLNDQLGSNATTTDQTGAVVENTSYDPWGLVLSGGTQSKFQYTGQEKDPETALNYYNARYYNPVNRHFTQPDDITPNIYNPQTLNRYSYVTNNPLRYTDPTGHQLVQMLGSTPIGQEIESFAITELPIWTDMIFKASITDPRVSEAAANFINDTTTENGVALLETFTPENLTDIFGPQTPLKLDKIYKFGKNFNEYYPYAYNFLSLAMGNTTPSQSTAAKNPSSSSVPMSSFTQNTTSVQSAKTTNNSNITNNSNTTKSTQNTFTNFNNQIYLANNNSQKVLGFSVSFSINSLMKNADPYHFIKL